MYATARFNCISKRWSRYYLSSVSAACVVELNKIDNYWTMKANICSKHSPETTLKKDTEATWRISCQITNGCGRFWSDETRDFQNGLYCSNI